MSEWKNRLTNEAKQAGYTLEWYNHSPDRVHFEVRNPEGERVYLSHDINLDGHHEPFGVTIEWADLGLSPLGVD